MEPRPIPTPAEALARGVGPAAIDVAYETFGDPGAPPVLLIMGVAAQLVSWPLSFCEALAAEGLYVVRFDNRDSGRSTHMTGAPPPDLPAALAGDLSSASYTLRDMAGDTVGLMDALGLTSAHLVGASMGAAIAQTAAIDHPARVRSLTSMMFTTGAPGVGQPDPAAMKILFSGPPATTREGAVAQALRASQAVGSTGFPIDEAEITARAELAFSRGSDPVAVARQAIATVASGDRTAALRGLSLPTLVVHGRADRMVDVSGGIATAAAIPGAELWLIDGMGHDLPRGIRGALAARIAAHIRLAEGARQG